jgi:hypothetical protein
VAQLNPNSTTTLPRSHNITKRLLDKQKDDVGRIRTCAPEGTRFLVLRDNHSATTPMDVLDLVTDQLMEEWHISWLLYYRTEALSASITTRSRSKHGKCGAACSAKNTLISHTSLPHQHPILLIKPDWLHNTEYRIPSSNLPLSFSDITLCTEVCRADDPSVSLSKTATHFENG